MSSHLLLIINSCGFFTSLNASSAGIICPPPISDRFQTLNSQDIGGGHIFQELQNPAEDVSREVKVVQEMTENQQKGRQ